MPDKKGSLERTKRTGISYFNRHLYPASQKVAGFYVIPSEPFECPSVRPSVSVSFPDSNLSSFLTDFKFFKLYTGIDIK